MKAIWNGKIIAESNHTQEVENNHYFPPEAIHSQYFQPSNTKSYCPWKGRANYFHLQVGENKNPDAAWFYPHPSPEASGIKNYVAFWNGVKIEK